MSAPANPPSNQEARLRAFVETINDVLFVLTGDGIFSYVSPQWKVAFGYELEETVGHPFVPFTHPDDVAGCAAFLQSVMATGEKQSGFEYRVRCKDGSYKWYSANASVTTDPIDGSKAFVGIGRDIAEIKALTQSLQESEFRWKFAIEGSGDGVWDWNIGTDAANYSRRWKEMLGYSDADILPTNDEWAVRIHPDDRERVAQTMQDYLDGKTEIYLVEYRLKCKDGSYKWILGRGIVVSRSDDGQPLRMIGTHTDITPHKQLEAALLETEERYRTAFMTSDDAIVITRLTDARYLDVNDGFLGMMGWTRDEVIGKTALDIDIWHHLVDRQRLVDALARDGYCRNLEAEFLTKDRRVLVGLVSARIIRLRGEQCMLLVTRDISERKTIERQVQQLAFYDPLTSLPNRRLLDDRLSQAIAASKRSGCHCALMFIDLDNFKPLNDAHGHHVGDLLLCDAAMRLRNCVREMDTVARFGGDEFVVILGELDVDRAESAELAMNVANKIQDALSSLYVLELPATESAMARTVTHQCSASIGVTLFFNHEGTQEEIFRWADSAMYRAKAAGRNCVCFHEH